MPREFGNVSLYAEHIPDEDQTPDGPEELPGFVEVGVTVDGARIPLARVKAGDVLEAIDNAEKSSSSSERGYRGGDTHSDQGF